MRDRVGEGKASGNLGNTLKMLGRFDEAIEACSTHLTISRQLKDQVRVGLTAEATSRSSALLPALSPSLFPELLDAPFVLLFERSDGFKELIILFFSFFIAANSSALWTRSSPALLLNTRTTYDRHPDVQKVGEGRALYNLGNVYHTKGKQMAKVGIRDPGDFPEDVKDCLLRGSEYYMYVSPVPLFPRS